MTKVVYVSGPMTGYPDHNFPAFNEAAKGLLEDGYWVINPADGGVIDGWEWSDYLRQDIKDLMAADAIYMLPDWRFSRGARLEYTIAVELGMDVMGNAV